jgi:DNA-binding NtrC family response regulator
VLSVSAKDLKTVVNSICSYQGLERRAKMRLLVVEDEPRMAQILHAALRSAAFAVDSVGTCEDAREAFSVVPYNAAVLDLVCRMAMASFS